MNSPIDVSTLDVKSASAALTAAAVRAKQLADKEEREIQRNVAQCIELQLKKLEIKMKQFDELEELLKQEREKLNEQQNKVLQERDAERAK